MPAKTHGMTGTRIYSIWKDMRRRCDSSSRKGYENYGGRGITYHPNWNSFSTFYSDMKEGYTEDMTLERINPNKSYNKENCIWILKSLQNKNKLKYRTNTTGLAGSSFFCNKGVYSLRVRITLSNGKRASKTYSLEKYSLEEAISLATIWRDSLKLKNNYSGYHGGEHEEKT